MQRLPPRAADQLTDVAGPTAFAAALWRVELLFRTGIEAYSFRDGSVYVRPFH